MTREIETLPFIVQIEILRQRVEKLEAQNCELTNLIKTYDKLLNPSK
jgi:hypothetical protein